MFNLILMKMGQIFFRSPAIHTKPPKMIVMNFANSVSSEPLILSLENITSVKFHVQLDSIPQTTTSNQTVLYNIIATIDKDEKTKTIKLISFENKKDADNALEVLIYKLYSPLKRFYQTILTIFFILLLIIFSKDILTATFKSNVGNTLVQEQSQRRSPTPALNNLNPSSVGNIDINTLPQGIDPSIIEKAQQIIDQQNKDSGNKEVPSQIEIPTPSVNIPPNVGSVPNPEPQPQLIQQPQTPADAFINNLNGQ